MKTLINKFFLCLLFVCFVFCAKAQGTWVQKRTIPTIGKDLATGFSIGHYGFIGTGQTSPSVFTNDFWRWDQNSNSWTQVANYAGAGKYGNTSFVINGKGYTCLGWTGSTNATDLWEYDTATNNWTQKASFPGAGRYGAFVFVIGTKAYVGCGEPNGQPYDQDVWVYDAITDTWTQVADFPGGNRSGVCAFSLNGYGYAGCGGNGLYSSFTDMYQYNPITNTWASVAPMPILGVGADAVSFVIDSLAYVGTGINGSNGQVYRNFFSYSAATNSWTTIASLTGAGRWTGVGFSIGNKGYAGVGLDSVGDFLSDFWEYGPASGTTSQTCNYWTQKASLTALNGRFFPTGFSIGNYGFIGTGQTSSGFADDFWKWNQNSNSWTQIANYAGAGKYGNTSFVIRGKGYTCLGWSGSANSNDLWEYDTASDTWTQKASFPGAGRYGAFVFVIGTKAYVGCGEPNGQPYDHDVWVYDAVADTWTQLSDFPGGNRAGVCAFSLNGYGYAGCGGDGLSTSFTDMYRYNPNTDTWTSVASIPVIGVGADAATFVIDSLAYVGTGINISDRQMSHAFFSYSATTDTWTPIATLTGAARWCGVGFSIGKKGYAGMGFDSVSDYLPDYWEYIPCSDTGHSICQITTTWCHTILYPNPSKASMTMSYNGLTVGRAQLIITDVFGKTVKSCTLTGTEGKITIDETGLSNGVYFYEIISPDKSESRGEFIIAK